MRAIRPDLNFRIKIMMVVSYYFIIFCDYKEFTKIIDLIFFSVVREKEGRSDKMTVVGNLNGVGVDKRRIGNMAFGVSCVKNFLIKNGFVYTVRGYRMRNMLVYVDGVGVCKRVLGRRSNENDDRIRSKEELSKWVEGSGFGNVEDWWDKIYGFCKDKDKWIYLVKIVK